MSNHASTGRSALAATAVIALLFMSRPGAPYPAPQEDAPAERAPGGKPGAGQRRVRFAIVPGGGRLTLDGREVSWFGATFALSPGPHRVRVEVPGSKCCRAFAGSIPIAPPPEGKPDATQVVAIRLEIQPARAVLVNAPPGAQFVCPTLGLTGSAGTLQDVQLPEAHWSGSCGFVPQGSLHPTHKATVTLDAGELNAIPWPAL
jgi:serine/threonine-protein kinase